MRHATACVQLHTDTPTIPDSIPYQEVSSILFHRYIGIDYSGASTPSKPLSGLQVFVADHRNEPRQQRDPESRNWSRSRLASWLRDLLLEDTPTIVGIDHAFSYPLAAMDEPARRSWDDFLAWFEEWWQTQEKTVLDCREANLERLQGYGKEEILRLADRWVPTAMPVCGGWEANGPNVFYSTHAGIPWLRWLRREAAGRVHFWPFDGFAVLAGKSVVAEVYPRVFRRRYPTRLTGDERDAWLVCQWLKDRDEKGLLAPYFQPPLDEEEARRARIEGWILGVA